MAVTRSGAIALGRASGELQFFHPDAFAGTVKPFSVIPGVVPLGGSTVDPVSLTVSANEKLVAVRTASGTAVWDRQQGERLGSNFASSGPGTPLLAPDGSHVIVSGDSATVLWTLDPAAWAAAACKAAGRNLTEAEWQTYFPGEDYTVTCAQWPPKPTL